MSEPIDSKLSKTAEHHIRRRWLVVCRTGPDRHRYFHEYPAACNAAREFHGELFRHCDPLRFRSLAEQHEIDDLIDPTEGQ